MGDERCKLKIPLNGGGCLMNYNECDEFSRLVGLDARYIRTC
jgi:hypothetical protein